MIDLANTLFSIPVEEMSQQWFAFTFKGKCYTWTRMLQGYMESPTVFKVALGENLDGFIFKYGSTLMQYVDDLLLCSPNQQACKADTVLLLKYSSSKKNGHKASKSKLQIAVQK